MVRKFKSLRFKAPWALLKELHEALEANQEQAKRVKEKITESTLKKEMSKVAARFENS